VLVLLPPSETKAPGGAGAPLELQRLSFPQLLAPRTRVVDALAALAQDPARAARALQLGPRQAHEVELDARLRTSATMPALERYTGVLYDALDAGSLRPAERARAGERLAVASALFGLVRAGDAIPAYRMSAGVKLPRIGSLGGVWKPVLGSLLAQAVDDELVVDLRSGAYQALAPAPGAVTVRVLTERADGSRGVVSHFNKATKGQLARLLARTTSEPSTIGDVARVARRGGLVVEQSGELRLDVITGA
jgi:uncharacterized protein